MRIKGLKSVRAGEMVLKILIYIYIHIIYIYSPIHLQQPTVARESENCIASIAPFFSEHSYTWEVPTHIAARFSLLEVQELLLT